MNLHLCKNSTGIGQQVSVKSLENSSQPHLWHWGTSYAGQSLFCFVLRECTSPCRPDGPERPPHRFVPHCCWRISPALLPPPGEQARWTYMWRLSLAHKLNVRPKTGPMSGCLWPNSTENHCYLVSVVNPAAGHRDGAASELTVEPGLLSHSNLHLLWWV